MKSQKIIFVLLPCALLSLVLAVISGWMRLGFSFQGLPKQWALFHGPWMVAGFLGIVIGLERAFALRKMWCYGSPLFSALGSFALLGGLPGTAAFCFATGGLFLVAVFIHIYRLQATLYHACLLGGAAFFFLGNALWLSGWAIPQWVNAWALFLIFTVAGERLELTRFKNPSARSLLAFKASLACMALGFLLQLFGSKGSWIPLGLGYLGMSAWLLTQDIARQNLKQPGLPRYMAMALLAGYAWLGFAGLIEFWGRGEAHAFAYDASLHSIFLGFVFSMIFAHGPLIFPSLLSLGFRFSPLLYGPLALLHASVGARMIGDFSASPDLRKASGLLSAASIAFFLGAMASSLRRGVVRSK